MKKNKIIRIISFLMATIFLILVLIPIGPFNFIPYLIHQSYFMEFNESVFILLFDILVSILIYFTLNFILKIFLKLF